MRQVNLVCVESLSGSRRLLLDPSTTIQRDSVYGNQRTKVKPGPARSGVLLCALLSSSAAAQSSALIDGVRTQAPGLSLIAARELEACPAPCARAANLALLLGVLQLSEGDPRGAVDTLSKHRVPKRLEAFHAWYLAEAQSWSGEHAAALKSLAKARVGAPAWLVRRIDSRQAELLLATDQPAKAKAALDPLLAEQSTPELLLARALARLSTNAAADAAVDLRALVTRWPTHPHAIEAMRLLSRDGAPVFSFDEQLQRSQALLAAGAPSDALQQLEAISTARAKDRALADARVALLKGQALLAMGKEADGFRALEVAINGPKAATAAEALMTKARRLMRNQDHAGARALMLELDARYPTSGPAEDASYLAAWLALADHDFARAVVDFEAFEQRHPGSRKLDEARWYTAWALFRSGRADDARATLARLIDDFPRSSLVPQAMYWSARIAQLAATPTDSWKAYRELCAAFPGTLYAALAAQRLAEGHQPTPKDFGAPPKPLTVKPSPKLALALELAETGLLKDASEALGGVVASVSSPDEALSIGHALQRFEAFGAAHALAARWLWGQVYTAQRPEALALMYPRAYRETVEAFSSQASLDPHLAWAIMRRESGFRPDVVSSADARGLMQIIPPTARAIASELKAPTPDPDELYSPTLNVRFGTWYLAALLDRLGHPALCAAAYNAGPGAVTKWLEQRGQLPLDEFIEEIPYKETRGYVKQVLADYLVYHALYGTKGTRPSIAFTLPAPKRDGVTF